MKTINVVKWHYHAWPCVTLKVKVKDFESAGYMYDIHISAINTLTWISHGRMYVQGAFCAVPVVFRGWIQ